VQPARPTAMCASTQVVTDAMWAARAQRFPQHTPATREYYLLRSIFETHFPSPSALATVPKARRPFFSLGQPFCASCVPDAAHLQRCSLEPSVFCCSVMHGVEATSEHSAAHQAQSYDRHAARRPAVGGGPSESDGCMHVHCRA
jgi:hypothetical protein